MAGSRNSRPPDLLARVGRFVEQYIDPAEAVCVGLSGGCDSVVLLHLLTRLGLTGRLSAVHVHHGLSVNADRWAMFCADFCASVQTPLVIRKVVVARTGLGLEAAARAARYAEFSQLAGGCLLLAQHQGDQAETLLLNLLRGSGVTGAAAMPVARQLGPVRLMRPLLTTSRSEIEAYAHAQGLVWMDDESNADTALTRNFIRHEVLTVMKRRFRGAERALATAAGHFSEAAGLLDELAAADWQRAAEGGILELAKLRQFSVARAKNLLRWQLRQRGWQVPVGHRLEEFVRQLFTAAPDRHPELSLPDGVLRVARGRLCWLASR